ncbi:hypothetical protein VFPPC_15793 [Pochonia chlamydosporia 170]|uniref:Uncharacterized protein n=1 Tax=Pochonia chlamydosporia 170 TaxID=1380566 RepID=A0A179FSQ0_METCM|nr:hypothetical protein VFPPC_15793 [Pochonia chlamydosporia 170]OAQ68161.1 hypothetical protein VFPPC_15793 [Pochonia chlamydosporia 170]
MNVEATIERSRGWHVLVGTAKQPKQRHNLLIYEIWPGHDLDPPGLRLPANSTEGRLLPTRNVTGVLTGLVCDRVESNDHESQHPAYLALTCAVQARKRNPASLSSSEVGNLVFFDQNRVPRPGDFLAQLPPRSLAADQSRCAGNLI